MQSSLYHHVNIEVEDSNSGLSLVTAHALVCGRDHDQDGLCLKPRMRKPTAELTALLAKCTWVAEDVGCKVASRFPMLTLHIILNKASTASA